MTFFIYLNQAESSDPMSKFTGLALTALKSNFKKLDKPYKLNFAITYQCQSRCLTCNIWEIKPKNELTTEEIAEFARKNNYFKWIGITGGEPFLRSDIVEIVSSFNENCKDLYLLTMPTNSLCNPDQVEKKLRQILEMKIPKVVITVSLDGYSELHDKIRGVTGNYDKAIEIYSRLEKLKKEYKNLSSVFGYTLSKFNKGQFEATYESVKKSFPDITYNDFHINLAQTSENYYANAGTDIKAFDSETVEELNRIFEKREKGLEPMSMVENAFLKKLSEFAGTGSSPMRCRSLEASVFMDGWGNVYPSVMWNKKIGNIKETSYELSPILKGTEANEVMRAIAAGHEPAQWTSCESYQIILGHAVEMLR